MLIHFKLAEPFMDFACIVPNVFSEIRIELAHNNREPIFLLFSDVNSPIKMSGKATSIVDFNCLFLYTE